ncbi:MAG: NAD(+)/NADH kinase [Ignavibacteria bacterium]|nr:NAD(+)/NADH kinase [Ignavibacteria bacterium]
MTVGIIGNTTKENIAEIALLVYNTLLELEIQPMLGHGLKCVLPDSGLTFFSDDEIGMHSDIIISIGGDGTFLASSVTAYLHDKPIAGLNLGKLGFLAEVTTQEMSKFFHELKEELLKIEERIVLEASSPSFGQQRKIAFNDFVIDKGGWPKMIEVSILIDEEYVTTFNADGLIVSTPAGSTGYSLSTGGPIVSPGASVIALCPISAHSLTVRPLIVDAQRKITVIVESHYTNIHFNCDGQRMFDFPPPFRIEITKGDRPLKILRSTSFSYFRILRKKLFWGADFRKFNPDLDNL